MPKITLSVAIRTVKVIEVLSHERDFFLTLLTDLVTMNSSSRHFVINLVKSVLALGSAYFIYVKIISRPDFDEMLAGIKSALLNPSNSFILVTVGFLMLVNWLLETGKWKLLLQRFYPAGWLSCFRAVMSGVTVSIFTPNRTGEFAGRVMHMESGSRIKGAIAAIIGSMNQLLVTIIAGGMGLLFSLNDFMNEDKVVIQLVGALILAGMIGLIIIYFRLPLLGKIIAKTNALKKLALYARIFSLYTRYDLLKLTMLSAFRYLVFSYQFILMLEFFGVSLPYLEAMRLITLIYLVMAVVPSIALSELTVRGSVALYFLSPVAANPAAILAATSVLWLINLAIPAILGALSVFYFRLNR
ncbi:MAG: flippase-like domain-containing protein [Bacteroidia bacterium]|nr:flippase-like domain-containing protein [Bacteroidia bacterium]